MELNPMLEILKRARCAVAMLGLVAPLAHAVHLDVEVWGDGNRIEAGFCRTPGAVGCDLSNLIQQLGLPQGKLPIDGETRQQIFPTDFRDLPGGPYSTKNPGFQGIQNALEPNEILRYKGLGRLMFWDPGLRRWATTGNTRIRLFGGLNPESIIVDPAQCGGALICFRDGGGAEEGSTLFTADGIQGSPELVIDVANAKGALHTHLHLFLEDAQGVSGGQVGAYLVEMQVLSNLRQIPSKPFFVIFNAGLSLADFSQALLDRINAEPTELPPQSPELQFRADAGHDRLVRLRSNVTLDGTGSSYEPFAPNIEWRQLSGPGMALQQPNSFQPTFSPQQTGQYIFELKLSYGSLVSYDQVTFKVPQLGDVDGDGDIDRVDVALILSGSQSDETHIQSGDLRDLDGDGQITAIDATLAKNLCFLNNCVPPIGNQITTTAASAPASAAAATTVIASPNNADALLRYYLNAALMKNQSRYMALMMNQNPYMALMGNQNRYMALMGNQGRYMALMGNQSRYMALIMNQNLYMAPRRNQNPYLRR